MNKQAKCTDAGKETAAEVAARVLAAEYEEAERNAAEMRQHATRHMLVSKNYEEEVNKLRAVVEDLREKHLLDENLLTIRTDEIRWQAAEIASLRAQKDKLTDLLRVARCPDPNCDGLGNSWQVLFSPAGEPEQERIQCRFCCERDSLVTPQINSEPD